MDIAIQNSYDFLSIAQNFLLNELYDHLCLANIEHFLIVIQFLLKKEKFFMKVNGIEINFQQIKKYKLQQIQCIIFDDNLLVNKARQIEMEFRIYPQTIQIGLIILKSGIIGISQPCLQGISGLDVKQVSRAVLMLLENKKIIQTHAHLLIWAENAREYSNIVLNLYGNLSLKTQFTKIDAPIFLTSCRELVTYLDALLSDDEYTTKQLQEIVQRQFGQVQNYIFITNLQNILQNYIKLRSDKLLKSVGNRSSTYKLIHTELQYEDENLVISPVLLYQNVLKFKNQSFLEAIFTKISESQYGVHITKYFDEFLNSEFKVYSAVIKQLQSLYQISDTMQMIGSSKAHILSSNIKHDNSVQAQLSLFVKDNYTEINEEVVEVHEVCEDLKPLTQQRNSQYDDFKLQINNRIRQIFEIQPATTLAMLIQLIKMDYMNKGELTMNQKPFDEVIKELVDLNELKIIKVKKETIICKPDTSQDNELVSFLLQVADEQEEDDNQEINNIDEIQVIQKREMQEQQQSFIQILHKTVLTEHQFEQILLPGCYSTEMLLYSLTPKQIFEISNQSGILFKQLYDQILEGDLINTQIQFLPTNVSTKLLGLTTQVSRFLQRITMLSKSLQIIGLITEMQMVDVYQPSCLNKISSQQRKKPAFKINTNTCISIFQLSEPFNDYESYLFRVPYLELQQQQVLLRLSWEHFNFPQQYIVYMQDLKARILTQLFKDKVQILDGPGKFFNSKFMRAKTIKAESYNLSSFDDNHSSKQVFMMEIVTKYPLSQITKVHIGQLAKILIQQYKQSFILQVEQIHQLYLEQLQQNHKEIALSVEQTCSYVLQILDQLLFQAISFHLVLYQNNIVNIFKPLVHYARKAVIRVIQDYSIERKTNDPERKQIPKALYLHRIKKGLKRIIRFESGEATTAQINEQLLTFFQGFCTIPRNATNFQYDQLQIVCFKKQRDMKSQKLIATNHDVVSWQVRIVNQPVGYRYFQILQLGQLLKDPNYEQFDQNIIKNNQYLKSIGGQIAQIKLAPQKYIIIDNNNLHIFNRKIRDDYMRPQGIQIVSQFVLLREISEYANMLQNGTTPFQNEMDQSKLSYQFLQTASIINLAFEIATPEQFIKHYQHQSSKSHKFRKSHSLDLQLMSNGDLLQQLQLAVSDKLEIFLNNQQILYPMNSAKFLEIRAIQQNVAFPYKESYNLHELVLDNIPEPSEPLQLPNRGPKQVNVFGENYETSQSQPFSLALLRKTMQSPATDAEKEIIEPIGLSILSSLKITSFDQQYYQNTRNHELSAFVGLYDSCKIRQLYRQTIQNLEQKAKHQFYVTNTTYCPSNILGYYSGYFIKISALDQQLFVPRNQLSQFQRQVLGIQSPDNSANIYLITQGELNCEQLKDDLYENLQLYFIQNSGVNFEEIKSVFSHYLPSAIQNVIQLLIYDEVVLCRDKSGILIERVDIIVDFVIYFVQ